MKRFGCWAACLVALVILPAAWAGVRDEVVAPTVHIRVPGAAGSGTLIEHKGKPYVLTAAHVVESLFAPSQTRFLDFFGRPLDVFDVTPKKAELEFRDGRKLKGRPVWYAADWRDGGLDMALLEVEGDAKGLRPAELAPRRVKLEEGEDVFYCGQGGLVPFSLEKTIVNAHCDRFIRVNGHGWYGHSGSGVYVKRKDRWVLVGVLVQFCVHPSDHPKSPLECERGIRKFLKDFDLYAPKGCDCEDCCCGEGCQCDPCECEK